MSLDLSELRRGLRAHTLGKGREDDEDEISNDEADDFLNRSYWELEDKFPFKANELSTSFSTVADQSVYDLSTEIPSLSAIRKIRVEYQDDMFYPLDRVTIGWYNNQERYDYGLYPTKYVRDGNNLILFRTPSEVYNVDIYYLSTLADLAVDGDVPELPRSWHEILLFGGVWRYHMQNKDWEAVNSTRAIQYGLINTSVPVEAKEERDSTYASVTPVRNTWRSRGYRGYR